MDPSLWKSRDPKINLKKLFTTLSEARPHFEGDNNTMWLLLLDLYIVIFLSGSGLNARLIVCWLLTSYVMDSSESAIDPLIQLSARE